MVETIDDISVTMEFFAYAPKLTGEYGDNRNGFPLFDWKSSDVPRYIFDTCLNCIFAFSYTPLLSI
jgi:hypothetical protein